MNNARTLYGGESMHDFLSVVKLVLLSVSLLQYFMRYSLKNLLGASEYAGKIFTILVCLSLLCYSIWVVFLVKNKKSGFVFKHEEMIKAADSFIFVGFLTIMIWISNLDFNEYKFLLLFIIVISTLQSGMKLGILLSLSAASGLVLTDYVYMLKYNLSVNFANDIVTSAVYVAVAWIIGYYVKTMQKNMETKNMQLESLYRLLDLGKQKRREMDDALLKYKLETKQLEVDMKKNIELLSNISHDLKTPLNVIFAALQLLYPCKDCGKKKVINKHIKYVDVMKQNCYRLMKMINALLDVTRINSGRLKLDIRNTNMVSTIENIVDSVVPYAEERNIDIVFDTDVEEKIMGVDIDKMERIILNLLSNSMKFTKCNGKIAVNFKNMDDHVLISVEDNGIGIPEDKLEVIFKRFSQVESIYRGNSEGSGIGLYLVKSFVEMHGGEIYVESKYGSGSKFTVKLPARTAGKNHMEDVVQDHEVDRDRLNVELSDITL
ncbi:MAG: HAMP domain-containing histidine kinase [Clostridium sp.]|jgi:signal transduction histidine kinase|uniref:sensor histidine kinase n=1 Tax=Clostridium sp. TaxID=1506 RepID=UPI0025B97E80|nr:HAMP domain-containing sensor histidine kinase [Clostridium sp.]MCH3965064.1 HAMP domain-containing histidine kinase [Clostridium sp.]MCI1714285.1 HAMP domain-containing histidine kinase [Clostridium sp.]MCI1798547.1 HAMP domain-containing histidine kinase [Clostridium sp.]MCI1812722.1 HAMP domain-containing histidine kinase [Clostridium sp.]MCI1869356.1 HAMP domain-containing histidine kinase [Clostridium sp.]